MHVIIQTVNCYPRLHGNGAAPVGAGAADVDVDVMYWLTCAWPWNVDCSRHGFMRPAEPAPLKQAIHPGMSNASFHHESGDVDVFGKIQLGPDVPLSAVVRSGR